MGADMEDYDRYMDERGHEACAQMLARNSARDRRELLDEIAWLHSELHGAEMDAKKAAELKAENERLRSCLSDTEEHATMFMWENKQLEEERDKLRELVRDMAAVIWTYDYTSDDDCPPALPMFEDSLRELGVEVEQ